MERLGTPCGGSGYHIIITVDACVVLYVFAFSFSSCYESFARRVPSYFNTYLVVSLISDYFCWFRDKENNGDSIESGGALSFPLCIDLLQYLISDLEAKNYHSTWGKTATLTSYTFVIDPDIMEGRYRTVGNGNNCVDESLFGSGPRKTSAAKKWVQLCDVISGRSLCKTWRAVDFHIWSTSILMYLWYLSDFLWTFDNRVVWYWLCIFQDHFPCYWHDSWTT